MNKKNVLLSGDEDNKRVTLIIIFMFFSLLGLTLLSRNLNHYHFSSNKIEKKGLLGSKELYDVEKLKSKMILLHPNLSKEKASEYGQLFYYYGKKHKINPYLLVAIAYQESTFKLEALSEEDFCMMQINKVNVEKLKLNSRRLVKDSAYCIETGAKILSFFKQTYSKEEADWWTRYNASNREARNIYKQRVQRHLSKLLKS